MSTEPNAEREAMIERYVAFSSRHAGGVRAVISADFALTETAALRTQLATAREALTRLRDCDWVITPANRMDAVRDIAREALAKMEEQK